MRGSPWLSGSWLRNDEVNAAMLKKSNSTDVAKMQAAMKNLTVESPFGKITWRAQDKPVDDGASTLAAWRKRTVARCDGSTGATWTASDVQPTDEEAKRLRSDSSTFPRRPAGPRRSASGCERAGERGSRAPWAGIVPAFVKLQG